MLDLNQILYNPYSVLDYHACFELLEMVRTSWNKFELVQACSKQIHPSSFHMLAHCHFVSNMLIDVHPYHEFWLVKASVYTSIFYLSKDYFTK